MPVAILFPIVFPIAAGALLPVFRIKNRRAREIYVGISVVINSLVILGLLLNRSSEGLTLFSLAERFVISLDINGMGRVFAGLVAFLWPWASLYAFEYMKHEGGDDRFFSFYTMTYGVTIGIAFSANIITMYFFYEMLTLVTLPLVIHSMNRRSVAAGKKYIAYSIGGAALAIIGIVILYGLTDGTLPFVHGGLFNADTVNPDDRGMLFCAYILMFFGFGVKAAVFPLYAWLPDASAAPTPVTALLHAVAVVKAGAFAIMRTIYSCFGIGFLYGTWAQSLTMIFALITILFGSCMALREQHLKRRLAYSTVSNLSYIVFGATLMTPLGLVGSLAHMVFHGIMKITLFYCVGAVMHQSGREYITQINGFGKKMPITFAAFTIGSLGMTGIPLLPGFLSKFRLCEAAIQTGLPLAYLGIAALILSAILTAGYLFGILIRAFFPGEACETSEISFLKDPNLYMTITFVVLSIAMLFLGMGGAGWLFDALTKIAHGAL